MAIHVTLLQNVTHTPPLPLHKRQATLVRYGIQASSTLARLLPGSCPALARLLPALARLLPGSCPALARLLPGSCPLAIATGSF